MDMSIKQIDRAYKSVKKIKVLDKEIIAIDAFALSLIDGNMKTSFSIKGFKPKEAKVRIDEDGDLIMPKNEIDHSEDSKNSFFAFAQLMHRREPIKKITPDHRLKFEISDETTLQMLGVLLSEKQNKREKLIQELKQTGFNF